MTRPQAYTQALADSICRRIIGGEALNHICDEEGMPSVTTIHHWRHDNAAFAEQYAKAREYQADTLFDEILEIADTPQLGKRTETGGKYGTKVIEGDMTEHRKLRIQARQWILPRLSKRMQDKAMLDHTSSDGSMTPMTDEAAAARLTAIHKAALAKVAAMKKGQVDDGSDLV